MLSIPNYYNCNIICQSVLYSYSWQHPVYIHMFGSPASWVRCLCTQKFRIIDTNLQNANNVGGEQKLLGEVVQPLLYKMTWIDTTNTGIELQNCDTKMNVVRLRCGASTPLTSHVVLCMVAMHRGSAQSFPAANSIIVYHGLGGHAVGQTRPSPPSWRSSPTTSWHKHRNRSHYNNDNHKCNTH